MIEVVARDGFGERAKSLGQRDQQRLRIATFSPEVRFLIRFQPNLPTGKAMTYPEIREFLTSNDVNFMGVSMAVSGKDMAENLIQASGICSFIVDLKQDESLENAFSNNIHADFFTLYPNEVTALSRWVMVVTRFSPS